jgi:hypothetical protein
LSLWLPIVFPVLCVQFANGLAADLLRALWDSGRCNVGHLVVVESSSAGVQVCPVVYPSSPPILSCLVHYLSIKCQQVRQPPPLCLCCAIVEGWGVTIPSTVPLLCGLCAIGEGELPRLSQDRCHLPACAQRQQHSDQHCHTIPLRHYEKRVGNSARSRATRECPAVGGCFLVPHPTPPHFTPLHPTSPHCTPPHSTPLHSLLHTSTRFYALDCTPLHQVLFRPFAGVAQTNWRHARGCRGPEGTVLPAARGQAGGAGTR